MFPAVLNDLLSGARFPFVPVGDTLSVIVTCGVGDEKGGST